MGIRREKSLSGSYFFDEEAPMSTDLLYYIMDYSGNYYKINKENQLVVAASEKEADVLTFEQANRRVGVGKKSLFYFIIPVENISVEKDGMDTNQSSAKNLANKEIQEPIKKMFHRMICPNWIGRNI